jgi:hypothetical protein
MKVGDLVKVSGERRSTTNEQNWLGIIVGFEDDNDPIVMWNAENVDGYVDECHTMGEYRKHVKVINESR